MSGLTPPSRSERQTGHAGGRSPPWAAQQCSPTRVLQLVARADVPSPPHLARAPMPGAMKGSPAKGLPLALNGWHEYPKTGSVLTPPCPTRPGQGSPLPAQHLHSFSAQTLLQEVSSPAGWVVANPSCRVGRSPVPRAFGGGWSHQEVIAISGSSGLTASGLCREHGQGRQTPPCQ